MWRHAARRAWPLLAFAPVTVRMILPFGPIESAMCTRPAYFGCNSERMARMTALPWMAATRGSDGSAPVSAGVQCRSGRFTVSGPPSSFTSDRSENVTVAMQRFASHRAKSSAAKSAGRRSSNTSSPMAGSYTCAPEHAITGSVTPIRSAIPSAICRQRAVAIRIRYPASRASRSARTFSAGRSSPTRSVPSRSSARARYSIRRPSRSLPRRSAAARSRDRRPARTPAPRAGAPRSPRTRAPHPRRPGRSTCR